MLREPEPRAVHPIMEEVIAIHVAEEARHISFAHEYLQPTCAADGAAVAGSSCRCTCRSSCGCWARRWSCRPRRFFRQFDIPRSVRKESVFRCTGIAPGVARHVRRRPNAVRRRGVDESVRAIDVAPLQNQRSGRRGIAASRSADARAEPGYRSLNPLPHNTSGDRATNVRSPIVGVAHNFDNSANAVTVFAKPENRHATTSTR